VKFNSSEVKSIILLLFFLAPASATKDAPDIILVNGKVWIGISDTDFQEAIAMKGNKIVAVGKSADINKTANAKTQRQTTKG
jgi:hypothetical protein